MRLIMGMVFLCLGNTVQAMSYEANFADLYEKHSESVVTVYTASLTIVDGKQARSNINSRPRCRRCTGY